MMLATRQISFAILLATVLVYSASAAPSERPSILYNDQARMLYEIRVTVKQAPGRFDGITGHVDYRVINPDCLPILPVTGDTVMPEEQTISIDFKPAGENVFRGFILMDAVKDEDYFGRGVCHWSVAGVVAGLRNGKVSFSPAIYKGDILSGREVVKHFSNRSYGSSRVDRIDMGADDVEAYNNPKATFSISLHAVARKRVP